MLPSPTTEQLREFQSRPRILCRANRGRAWITPKTCHELQARRTVKQIATESKPVGTRWQATFTKNTDPWDDSMHLELFRPAECETCVNRNLPIRLEDFATYSPEWEPQPRPAVSAPGEVQRPKQVEPPADLSRRKPPGRRGHTSESAKREWGRRIKARMQEKGL